MPKPEQLTTAPKETGRIEKPAIIDFVTLKQNEFITPWHKVVTRKKGVTGFVLSVDKFLRVSDGVEIRIGAIKVTDKDIQAGRDWGEQKTGDINAHKDPGGKKIDKLARRQMELSLLLEYANS